MGRRSGLAMWMMLAIVGVCFSSTALLAADDKPAKDVQGKWIRQQEAGNERITIIKEHSANTTTVTAYDKDKKVLYSHKSEFKTEQSGKVRIFTFFNRTITTGPDAGQTIKEPVSFVYRVANDRFIEVHGVLDGDPLEPNMIVWQRMPENANAAVLTR